MKIPVTLNEKKIDFDADPSESLLEVLRRENIFSVKCGCEEGHCGNCMILLDGEPVPSCIVKVGTVRDCKIITLEAFKSMPEYQDITTGFAQAGIHLCGYCNAGKYFTAYGIIRNPDRPAKPQLYEAIRGISPCCTDRDSLANGILYAIATKHTREGRRNNAKKL